MNKQNGVIKFERFEDECNVVNTIKAVFSFVALFIASGNFERNLTLPGKGLGLMEHINIWLFLAVNLIIPVVFYMLVNVLKNRAGEAAFSQIKNAFVVNAEMKTAKAVVVFSTVCGFWFFVGNSLQNANVINKLPFDYWDSINYLSSYVISRIYKLYLFVYFIPSVLVYTVVLMKSLYTVLNAGDSVKGYSQLKVVRVVGLSIIAVIAIPFLLISGNVWFVHSRFDITSVATVTVTVALMLLVVGLYAKLGSRLYRNVT